MCYYGHMDTEEKLEPLTVEQAFKRYFKVESLSWAEYWNVSYTPHGWVVNPPE